MLAGARRSGYVGQAAGMDLRRPIRPAVEGVPDARGRAREGPRLQNEWGGARASDQGASEGGPKDPETDPRAPGRGVGPPSKSVRGNTRRSACVVFLSGRGHAPSLEETALLATSCEGTSRESDRGMKGGPWALAF